MFNQFLVFLRPFRDSLLIKVPNGQAFWVGFWATPSHYAAALPSNLLPTCLRITLEPAQRDTSSTLRRSPCAHKQAPERLQILVANLRQFRQLICSLLHKLLTWPQASPYTDDISVVGIDKVFAKDNNLRFAAVLNTTTAGGRNSQKY